MDGVRRHIELARRLWTRPRDYSLPDFFLLFAESAYARASGEHRHGLAVLQAEWPALMKAPFVSSAIKAYCRSERGALALGVARLGGAEASEARALALG